jgi:hypothetical protein
MKIFWSVSAASSVAVVLVVAIASPLRAMSSLVANRVIILHLASRMKLVNAGLQEPEPDLRNAIQPVLV